SAIPSTALFICPLHQSYYASGSASMSSSAGGEGDEGAHDEVGQHQDDRGPMRAPETPRPIQQVLAVRLHGAIRPISRDVVGESCHARIAARRLGHEGACADG